MAKVLRKSSSTTRILDASLSTVGAIVGATVSSPAAWPATQLMRMAGRRSVRVTLRAAPEALSSEPDH